MYKPAHDRQPRLTRPAGENQQHAARRPAVVGDPDLEMKHPGHATAVIERHRERRAGESAGAGARVGIAQRGLTRLARTLTRAAAGKAGEQQPGESA
jgi:hypothetical protein